MANERGWTCTTPTANSKRRPWQDRHAPVAQLNQRFLRHRLAGVSVEQQHLRWVKRRGGAEGARGSCPALRPSPVNQSSPTASAVSAGVCCRFRPTDLQQVGQRGLVVQQLVGGQRVQVLRQVALQARQQPLAPHLYPRGRGRALRPVGRLCNSAGGIASTAHAHAAARRGWSRPQPSSTQRPRARASATSSCWTRGVRRSSDTSASFTNSSACACAFRCACRLSCSTHSCCSYQAGVPTCG